MFVALVALTALMPRAEAALPANGRAWELMTVNPPSSSRVVGVRPVGEDGERIVYGAAGPPKDSPSGAGLTYGSAVRGPSGWYDVPIGVPYEGEFPGAIPIVVPTLAAAFAADEETILWLSSQPLIPGSPPEGTLALYRQLPGGAVQLISKLNSAGITLFYGGFADISSDGSRAVFASEEHLLPADAARTQGMSIYAWNGSGVEIVDVDDGGALLSNCGARVINTNGMSTDARRVFLTTSTACGDVVDRVFLRDIDSDDTTEISASRCTRLDCNALASVAFAGATPDGDFAYLTSTQQLTNADEDFDRDLYRYDVAADQLSLLSEGPPGGFLEAAEMEVFPSDGGERVYYRATHQTGPELFPQALFVADGSGTRPVAFGWVSGFPQPGVSLSRDGGKMLFTSSNQLEPGDTDFQDDAYLYDAVAETLTRVSQGPSGGNEEQTVLIEAVNPSNRQGFEFGNRRLYYAIDGAGERAFFQTAESLVPEDTNGVDDVYEWWNGEVGLVTPGNQPLSSEIAGMSRDGRTLIFGTNASLVGRDADGESRDLYAARLGGGFPEPPPPPPGCDVAACPLPSGQRIARSNPSSMGQAQGKRSVLRVISVATKARKGAFAAVVSVPAPGAVSGQIAIPGKKGKKVVLAAGKARAKQAGEVQLKLSLTAPARRAPWDGAKNAQLTVSQGSSKVSQTVKVSLR